MTDLVRFGSGQFPSRLERSTSRALDRVRADQTLASAHEVAKVEVIAEVTEAAMLALSHVSSMEQMLAERTPHAAARLRHIADTGALGMAGVVMGATRRMR